MSKYCEICDIDLYDNLEYQNHLIGKRHLKNVRHKDFEKRILEHSIFVPNIPKSITPNTLIAFFQQYGPIAKYKTTARYAIIEYESSEPVDYLLNNPIHINECKLQIKRRTLFHISKEINGDNSVEEVDPININIIKDKFKNEPTFNSQFTIFLDAIQLKDTDIVSRYNVICPSLDIIFASVFPNCRSYRFGSTLTGLGFKECDLDIYMDIGAPIHNPDDEKQPLKVHRHLWTMKKIFNRVKGIMYRMKDVFTNIRPILNARTPIIKFCYVPTNISCDISFKNGFALYNSQLIKHCLSYDVRIKPLIMLIKYWARQRRLTLCGQISNYALILMIIFYLQQPEQGILPPLMDFLVTSKPIYINGWQVNSDENVMLSKRNNDSNNNNIPELLKGFFEFYTNFNFVTNVVCPLDGVIHKKQEFNDTESLPNLMMQHKNITAKKNIKLSVGVHVCIQDPIELDRNVAISQSKRLIDTFKYFCKMSADICISSREDNYKNLLISLLQPVDRMKHNQSNLKEFRITINAECYLNVALPDDFEKREDITDKKQYKKDNLFFTTFNIVKDIFEKVFMLEVEILSTDNETKQQKIEVLSDVHTREHKQLLLRCRGNCSIWLNRKSNITILDPSMSALDKEAAISSKIAERIQNKGSKNAKLNFTCKFEREENSVKFQLTFINMSRQNNVFNNFRHIAAGKIPKITDKTLMHMLQFRKHY